MADPLVGTQYFTVEYVDEDGRNYLNSIYNKANVNVFVDFSGGTKPNTEYTRIEPGYENGKFGPFNYTEMFVDPISGEVNTTLLYGNLIRYDYYIKKDTFGQDKLTVEFLLGVDECNAFWQEIKYYQNDKLLEAYTNQQQAQITIVE